MTDLEALQDNLILNPDDVVTRSVYADCLDEVGEVNRTEVVRSRLETSYWKSCECPTCGGEGREETDDYLGRNNGPMELGQDGELYYVCKRCCGRGTVPGAQGEEWLFGLPEDPANPSEARLLDARAKLKNEQRQREEARPHGTLSMSVGGIPFHGTWREVG